MKLEITGSETTSTSRHKARRFGVAAGPQMFRTMSSTLYPDKIKAIIRELTCNAWDSHVAAGKRDVPVEVHLPTMHEPWFAVKDEGTGLCDDDIYSLICNYFASSKVGDNAQIGMLGLGSKSPFCYKDEKGEPTMYSIVSTFEGETRVYTAFMDEEGNPDCQQQGETAKTPNRPNGIEMRFPVKQSDIWEFENKAKIALEFFEPKPKLNVPLEVNKQAYALRAKNGRWALRKGVGGGVRAVMGNVAYSVGSIDISRLSGGASDIASLPLDLFFEIGEISFTVSREQAELDERTVKAVVEAYKKVREQAYEAIRERIDACPDMWKAWLLIYDLTSTDAQYNPPALAKLVNDAWRAGKLFGKYKNFELREMFPHLCTFEWSSTAVLRFVRNDQAYTRSRKTEVFRPNLDPKLKADYEDKIASAQDSDELKRVRSRESRTIVVEPGTHFVINDIDGAYEKYVHYLLQGESRANDFKHAYVFTRDDKKAAAQPMAEEAVRMLGSIGGPKFEMMSDLVARYGEYVKTDTQRNREKSRSGRRPIVELKEHVSKSKQSDGWSGAWEKSESQRRGVKYYIPLVNLKGIECGFAQAWEFRRFVGNVRSAGVFGLDASTPVYGLRKNAKLRRDPEWVELTGHVFQCVLNHMTPQRERELTLLFKPFDAATHAMDEIIGFLGKNPGVLPADSPLMEFALFREGIAKHEVESGFKEVLDEATRRGHYKRGPVPDLNIRWQNVIRLYPLLQMASFNYDVRNKPEAWRKAIFDYVRMVDRAREEEEAAATAAAAGD